MQLTDSFGRDIQVLGVQPAFAPYSGAELSPGLDVQKAADIYPSQGRLGTADSEGGRSRPSMASATLALPCAAYEVDPLACVNCGSK